MLPKYASTHLKLLFTDTDSLCYQVFTDDFYRDIQPDSETFDIADYPKQDVLHSPMNKKVIGKFKNETSSCPIREFVGLRPKMYTVDSLLTDTSVKRTPRVGPCLCLFPLFDSL